MLLSPLMARPKSVNPNGEIKKLVALVPVPLHEKLRKKAQRRGIPVAELVRELLEQVA